MRPLELEGFLTGVIVSPELVPTSQWLEALWGEDEPVFDSSEQAQIVLDCVMGLYNTTIEKIDSEGGDWRPMFMDSIGEPQLEQAEAWVRGFWEAAALAPEAWPALASDERTQVLIEPFVALIEIAKLDGGLRPDNADEIRHASAKLIPHMLPVLRKLGQLRSGQPAYKPGRNESCPCGSGKKYKRCCGLN